MKAIETTYRDHTIVIRDVTEDCRGRTAYCTLKEILLHSGLTADEEDLRTAIAQLESEAQTHDCRSGESEEESRIVPPAVATGERTL